jgi:hypothetical protein
MPNPTGLHQAALIVRAAAALETIQSVPERSARVPHKADQAADAEAWFFERAHRAATRALASIGIAGAALLEWIETAGGIEALERRAALIRAGGAEVVSFPGPADKPPGAA